MNFSLFLALRYLKPKRTFVSVITLLSVIGVCFGVTALMVVISVMAGFEREIKETVLGFEPHITLVDYGGKRFDENGFALGNGWAEVQRAVEALPEVEAVSPFIEGPVFLEVGSEPLAALMRAIDPVEDVQLEDLKEQQLVGTFDLEGNKVVLGADIAGRYGVRLGDMVTVYAPSGVKDLVGAVRELEDDGGTEDAKEAISGIRQMLLPFDLEVSGILGSPQHGQALFLPLDIGLQLSELEDAVPTLAVRTTDPFRTNEFVARVLGALPETGWDAVTWTERHANRFAAVRMERTMMYFVLFIIMLVAGFCIMVTMITVTVQKRQEIGVIGAVGARVSQIVWVFLGQGMVVGAVGVLSGLGLGALILHNRNHIRELIRVVTQKEIFDSSIYGVIEIPSRVLPVDLAVISGGAFMLCSLAALVPALFAARIDPAKALRNL